MLSARLLTCTSSPLHFTRSESDATPSSRRVRVSSGCRRVLGGVKYDPHTVCILCRGGVCHANSQCQECTSWSSSGHCRRGVIIKLRRRPFSLPVSRLWMLGARAIPPLHFLSCLGIRLRIHGTRGFCVSVSRAFWEPSA